MAPGGVGTRVLNATGDGVGKCLVRVGQKMYSFLEDRTVSRYDLATLTSTVGAPVPVSMPVPTGMVYSPWDCAAVTPNVVLLCGGGNANVQATDQCLQYDIGRLESVCN